MPEQPRKIIRTQHVRVAGESRRHAAGPAHVRRRERPIEIWIGDLWRCIDDRESEAEFDFPDFQRALRLDIDHQAKGLSPVLCIRSSATPKDPISCPTRWLLRDSVPIALDAIGIVVLVTASPSSIKAPAPDYAIGGDLCGAPGFEDFRSGDRHGIFFLAPEYGARRIGRQVRKVCQF